MKIKAQKLINSIWIFLTLLVFLNWTAFLYIGIRVKNKKWIMYSIIYMLLNLIVPAIFWTKKFDGTVLNVISYLVFFSSWSICILHARNIQDQFLEKLIEIKSE